ncbi:MAG: hypothetical protein U0Z17_01810 [Bacteroidales bacterium]
MKDYAFEALRGIDCYTVMLPAGSHHVEIVTGDRFSYGINLASLWSISAIALYGSGSSNIVGNHVCFA